jgi:hypothetical protein
VLTTSQKLAHRIVRELSEAFRGAAHHWSAGAGTLRATWERLETRHGGFFRDVVA